MNGSGRSVTTITLPSPETDTGAFERAIYDKLFDDLARSFLKRFDPTQRDRLVNAMVEVERLLCVGGMELGVEAPNSAAAQWCLERYFAELATRFEAGFDLARSNSASIEEMTPPAGFFVIARLDGTPAG